MKDFYIITNELKDRNLACTGAICEYLHGKGARCERLRGIRLENGEVHTPISAVPEDAQCILVLGGDGTLLQAARDLALREIALFGVNLGTLGYLAEVEYANVWQALDALLSDNYTTEDRMMLSGEVVREGQIIEDTYALNDIALTRNGPLQILNFNIYVNGQLLNRYSADGIVIATPTGSTGYNMSAGGPIVEPKAQLILLTPICPHTLNTRSIILSAQDEVLVEVDRRHDGSAQPMEVSFDGSHKIMLTTGDVIRIRKSLRTTSIVKLQQISFLEVLHKKMSE